MASQRPPTSQQDRPIRLELDGVTVDFTIRPEDLQWTEPSRLVAQQTFGGAWLDSFGPGIANITIAGNTGWRPQNEQDWKTRFENLHALAFKRWHELVDQRKDPNSVELKFVDTLDARAVVVAPTQFVLRRSKSRPLLLQYNIAFIVVRDLGVPPEPIEQALTATQNFLRALASLRATLGVLNAYVRTGRAILAGDTGSLVGAINAAFGAQAGEAVNGVISVMHEAGALAESIMTTANSSDVLPDGLRSSVLALSAALTAILRHLAAGVTSGSMLALLMAGAAAAHNLTCLFANAFIGRTRYLVYDEVYGASTCSSTSGGRDLSPLANANAFESVMPAPSSPVAVSVPAAAAITTLRASDPVLSPLSSIQVTQFAQTIANGVSVGVA